MPDELPPVIAVLLGDASDLFSVLDEVEARLEAFADQTFNANLGLNIEQVDTGIADAEALLQTFADQTADANAGLDIGDLAAEIAAAAAELRALEDQATDIPLGIDDDNLVSSLAAAKAFIDSWAKVPTLLNVGVDQGNLVGSLAASDALLQAFAAEQYFVTVNPHIAENMAIEQMAELEATLAAMGVVPIEPALDADHVATVMAGLHELVATRQAEIDVEIGQASLAQALLELGAVTAPEEVPIDIDQASLTEALAELGAFRVAADAELAGIGDNLAVKSTGALLASLGFSGGSFVGLFTAIGNLFSAQFGSISSLAGFGPEHLITTLLGLGGSAAGAGVGGLALGLSSLGVAATGFGTDLAGIGQAADDIKNVSSAMNSLSTAVATYGQGSTQALAAQSQLNQALTSFNPVAQQAVQTAAEGLGKIGNEFDTVTGQAEKMGAEIITSLEGVAMDYLPTIGKFATENTAIIQKALDPLFAWMKNTGTQGGLGIFNELEEVFQQHLPAAMGAFDNGIELLARTIALVAPYTGHFIDDLDAIFTKLNSTGWTGYSNEVIKLVGLFHTWADFIGILVRDIGALFSRSAGLGAGIIGELTTYLDELHSAIDSVAGNDALKRLFEAHKAEMLDLIALVVDLGRAFVSAYMVIAPTLTEIATLIIKIADDIVKVFDANPVTKFLLGFGMLVFTTKILTAAMVDLIAKFLAFIGIDVAGWVTEAGGAIGILITMFHSLGGAAITAGLDEDGAITGGAVADGLTDFGVGAETAAEGVGGLTLGLGALTGAIAPVAVGLGLAAGAFLIVKNANDGWAQSVSKLTGGVENLPTQTLPQLQTALAATNAEIKKLTDTTTTIDKVNHTARDSFGQNTQVVTKYGSAVQQLQQYAQNLEAPIKAQEANFKTLNTTFGISQQSAEALAQSLGLNLDKALTTTQIQQFAAALQKQDTQIGLSQNALNNMAATAHTTTSAVSSDVENAMQTTSQAWQGFGNAVTNFAGTTVPAGAAIKAFYAQSLAQATTFNTNIQKAIGEGYSAQLISQIEQAGPQESGFLQGLVDANGQGLQTLITQASNAISAEGVQAVQEARLTQEAVSAKSSAMTSDLSTALAISQALTTSNISASLTSLISHLSGGYAQFLKVANEYGIAIPNSIKAQLGATAAAGGQAGTALATGFGGGISSHTSVAIAAANGLGLGAIGAIKNSATGAFAIGQSLPAGVAEGIIQGQQAAFAAAHNLGIGTVNAMREATQSKSPSRLAAQLVGLPIAQGVALGMMQNAHLVTNAAKAITSGIFSGANAGLSIGLSGGGGVTPVQASSGGGTTTMVSQPVNIVINGQTIASTVLDILLKSARSRGNLFSQFGGSTAAGTATGINRTNSIAR